ncbi:hypothetical protein CHLNCDRAFT_142422 [Chlorella variabilis]|uniref:LCCL domain-containing protein n=1 Tax=Chlorella variabilis TaxID=554065 RepID=E1Z734_CHLVA|nr:hypothetical protein CHLNCDRAFT_142422 [Chlorella variabilis]EFN58099.1 hypothetical protein CHLNCDRAFT_142422 [Chlorella variabilis]|eukprot:XP_005850201.1 hypothetical protein CHLNCDRAFT_142422 [Chlorella variabilis]
MSRLLRSSAALLLLLALGCAVEAATVIQLDCGRTNADLVTVNRITTKATVKCPANCKAAGGTIYGTGTYTHDSRICLSAIHAGAITNTGGQFTLYYAKGRTSYTGSTKFTIKSNNYGTWPHSIKFVGPALQPSIDCDKNNYSRDVVGVGQGVLYNRTKLTVACPKNCLAAGGTAAPLRRRQRQQAVDPNAVPPPPQAAPLRRRRQQAVDRNSVPPSPVAVANADGGLITIYDFPGLQSYRGSTANTIKSSNYGSWGHSYRFKPVANLTCASTNAQNLLVNATVTKSFAVCPMNCFSAGGNIYGSSAAYRSNSRICLAAHHAGVITSNGGMVILQYVKGLASYKSVTANFVTSKTAAASPNAFKFI